MLTAVVYRNVQVTLQILTALIEKAPRDLPLYAGSVLSVIATVLHSKDITMVEETIPTFETFCEHQDIASLTADSERTSQYQDIVRTYASFASRDPPIQTKTPLSTPVAIRWRSAGLHAIKSVVGSEALGTDGGKQLNIVMPVILQNLFSDNMDFLSQIQSRVPTSEKSDLEHARKRRMSIATVQTVDTTDANPASASGTTADADKVAEEEVRTLALRCLKQIFVIGSNRVQLRIATALTLRFIASRNPPRRQRSESSSRSTGSGNWATSLIEMVARLAPVQDRFIILVTAMETLVRSPVVEERLDQQLTLATMIDWLLSSSVNLIGLSVMDVLLGIVQHILLLLQLGGRDSKLLPHHQQTDGIDLFQDAKETFEGVLPSTSAERFPASETSASPIRQELLARLQKCIGSLATHIYYTDQISDMITAIIARLKPSPLSEVPTTAASIENPAATANAIANSVNLQEDPTTDSFFTFATARVTALKAIKDILIVANLRRSITGSAAESRNRVGVQVWEGTQWLIRDEDREVRQAYVDALLTWLKQETNKNDLKVTKETRKASRASKREVPHTENADDSLARRAVSNASQREKAKSARSTFLQLLHLAIYDNAIECPEIEPDILLLHLLLANLIEKLGVNAAKHGLPMIVRLQEDIDLDDIIESSLAKLNIGSLVHGYFWALSEKFDFETSKVGYEIHGEISRRKKRGVWLDKIRLPPMPLDHIGPGPPLNEKADLPVLERESLKPYVAREELVESIATAYDAALASPAPSAPSSPGRVFSIPALGYGYGYGITPAPKPAREDRLPATIKEQMLTNWTKESCIAAIEKESTKTLSLSGSKTGTSGGRNYLNVNGNGNGSPTRTHSPTTTHHHRHHDHNRPSSAAYGLVGGLGGLQKLRRTSAQEGSPTPVTSSSRDSTVRVNELKRVLSVNNTVRHSSPLRGRPEYARSGSGTSGESMVSGGDLSASDAGIGSTDFVPEINQSDGPPRPQSSRGYRQGDGSGEGFLREGSETPKASTTAVNSTQPGESNSERPQSHYGGDDIPPVPPLPPSLSIPGNFPPETPPPPASASLAEERRPSTAPAHPSSVGPDRLSELSPPSSRPGRTLKRRKTSRPRSKRADKVSENSWGLGSESSGRVDLGRLLRDISVEDEWVRDEEEGGTAGMGRPPY